MRPFGIIAAVKTTACQLHNIYIHTVFNTHCAYAYIQTFGNDILQLFGPEL